MVGLWSQSEGSGLQLLAKSIQGEEEVSEFLEDLQEAIINYQV